MPVVDRANWPAFKPATTVRADIFEDSVDAGCTECAFMAADAGLPRVGRQVLSAIFTYGAQFKHVKSPALNEAPNNRTEGLGICPANCRSSGKTTLIRHPQDDRPAVATFLRTLASVARPGPCRRSTSRGSSCRRRRNLYRGGHHHSCQFKTPRASCSIFKGPSRMTKRRQPTSLGQQLFLYSSRSSSC